MSSSLLDRRLIFVVGKGGVGKTTVAAALGIAASARGKRVLIVEIESEDRLCPLLGLPPPAGPAPAEIRPSLFRASVGGREALEEYLALVIPVRRLLRAVFDSRIYQYFVAAAPGLKELMTIGKVWYEVDQARWDLVIVDCPATGHGLQYLRMPKVAQETFPSGLVHREAKRVADLLGDPVETEIVVVTTAEEMPVNETLEICDTLESDLGRTGGWLLVNRFHEAGLTIAEVDGASPSVRLSRETAALVAAVLDRGREEASWAAVNERHRQRLETRGGWNLVTLPFLFREEFGLSDVEWLAKRIAEATAPATSAWPRGRRR